MSTLVSLLHGLPPMRAALLLVLFVSSVGAACIALWVCVPMAARYCRERWMRHSRRRVRRRSYVALPGTEVRYIETPKTSVERVREKREAQEQLAERRRLQRSLWLAVGASSAVSILIGVALGYAVHLGDGSAPDLPRLTQTSRDVATLRIDYELRQR